MLFPGRTAHREESCPVGGMHGPLCPLEDPAWATRCAVAWEGIRQSAGLPVDLQEVSSALLHWGLPACGHPAAPGRRMARALSRVTHTLCAPPTASCHGHYGPSRTLGADVPGPVAPRRARLGAVSAVRAAEVPAPTHPAQPGHLRRPLAQWGPCRRHRGRNISASLGARPTHGKDRGWI